MKDSRPIMIYMETQKEYAKIHSISWFVQISHFFQIPKQNTALYNQYVHWNMI